jgi:DegV family protein with EDD domain
VIHVVTDSTSDITQKEAAAMGVTVVPLTVRFGDQQFRDGVDMDSDAFYKELQKNPTQPTTSQPTPEQFADVYRSLLQHSDDSIVSLHISGKLSGTLQSAHIAAQEVAPERIHLVDTESASAGVQLLLRAALDDIASGCDSREVAERTLRRRDRVSIYLLLDTLTYLQRGGRIRRSQALVGAMLSVKPVLKVQDGEVQQQGRVRSRQQGVDKILELLAPKLPVRLLAAFHCGSPELLPGLVVRLEALAPGVEIITGQVGPVVGAYTGPGGVGIAGLSAD